MILLVSGASRDVASTDPGRVGILMRPNGQTRMGLLAGRVWAVDNAAYKGFDATAFWRTLWVVRSTLGCKFVVCPDVVGNHHETRLLFDRWAPAIFARHRFPVAFAAQDGCTVDEVPWLRIAALFIGGTTEWKLSPVVDELLAAAKDRGIWRHVGRVNTRRRMRHFMGRCESIDGSGFSKYPKRIRLALRWQQQGRLI